MVPCHSLVKSSLALQVKRLSEHAQLPVRNSAHAAGYDLFAAADMVVAAEGKALIPTDLIIAVPLGTYGRIAPRSGLAWKHHLHTGAGVIDADYRGPVQILILNLAKQDYYIKRGERIAQLILECIITPDVVETQELDTTLRGAQGFGSTGIA
jgi:dUTP pyrophosphatase